MLTALHLPTDSIESLRKDAVVARSLGSGLTDEIRSRAVALREQDVPASEIADAIGVHETTLYGWVRSGKYKSPFRSVAIERPHAEVVSECTPRPTRKGGTPASPGQIRIRYPRGTRVCVPLAHLRAEILTALLSLESAR
jgi:hypothetical protein